MLITSHESIVELNDMDNFFNREINFVFFIHHVILN